MIKEILKTRAGVMKQSRELGRCICSLKSNPFNCPCSYMLKYKKCKCNNEELNGTDTQVEWANFNTKNNAKTK